MRSSWIRDRTCVPCIARQILNHLDHHRSPTIPVLWMKKQRSKELRFEPRLFGSSLYFYYSTILPLHSPSHHCIYLLSLTLPICFNYCGIINHPRITSLKQCYYFLETLVQKLMQGLTGLLCMLPLTVAGVTHSVALKCLTLGRRTGNKGREKNSIFSLCHIALFNV